MREHDLIIERLIEQNEFLFAGNQKLREVAVQFQQDNVKLREEIIELREKIDQLTKDSGNSSKPPSSDIVKPDRKVRKKVKRKRGAQKGHNKNTRQPFKTEQVDETIEYEFTDADAKGLVMLNEWHTVQQVSLPEKLYYVTEHKARKYMDPKTGKIHIAPLPDDVRKGGLLAADMSTAVAYMKGNCHMGISKN